MVFVAIVTGCRCENHEADDQLRGELMFEQFD